MKEPHLGLPREKVFDFKNERRPGVTDNNTIVFPNASMWSKFFHLIIPNYKDLTTDVFIHMLSRLQYLSEKKLSESMSA